MAKAAFSAVMDKGGAFGPFPNETTLVFSKVHTNICNAYHEDTGIFISPYDGVYYFTFFYHAGGEVNVNLKLMKNGTLIVRAGDHRSCADTADNGGNAAVLQLKQGDQVYVSMEPHCHVWAAAHSTSFSGFQI